MAGGVCAHAHEFKNSFVSSAIHSQSCNFTEVFSSCARDDAPGHLSSLRARARARLIDPMDDGVPDIKLVVLGESYTGKTSFINNYLYGISSVGEDGGPPSTVGVTFASKVVAIHSEHFKIQLWDTTGQERFDFLTAYYCRGVLCAIVVFDLTNRTSFEVVHTKWLRTVHEHMRRQAAACSSLAPRRI